jgi:hypothetical protein
MAEMFNPQNPEILELNRQRKYADLLTSQGLQTPQAQTVAGGVYVPPNPMEYLAKLFSTYTGTKVNEKLDTKEAALAKALREQGATETQGILSTLRGTPEVSTELAGPAYQGVAPTAIMPAKAGDANAALAQALMGQSPQAQRLVPSLIEQANPKPIAEQIKYDLAKQGGYKGTFNDFMNQMTEADKARIAIDKQRLGLEAANQNKPQLVETENGPMLVNLRTGQAQPIMAGNQPIAGGKPLTESQGNATAFGIRMKESNALINDLEKKGVTNTGIVRSTVGGIVGMTPFIGDKLQQGVQSGMNVLPGALGGPSPEQQQVDAARKNFITAVLRKESGAAISPTEFYTEAQKYFPQPGDSDQVIKQKSHARETAIKAMEIQAGPGKRQIEQMGAPKKVVNFNDLP